MCLEDIAQPARRRSLRIVAMEEKKQREKQALALARKSNSTNNVSDKGKAKANMYDDNDDDGDDDDDDDYFIDESDDNEQYVATKKRGRKSKTLHQLISSTQAMQLGGQYQENRSTSTRIATSADKVPERHVLEFVLDCLQRKDPDDLFAEPVNPNELKDYYRIVKQPMDFGTMRAKVHENMYTSMEQLKRDVYLMCTNAKNCNSSTTIYHQVVGPNDQTENIAERAENISAHAQKVFHGLSADPEQFDHEFSLNKKRPGRKPQGRRGRPRNSARALLPPKAAQARSCIMRPTAPDEERRHMCWPPSSLLSDMPQQTFQFITFNYQDSLLRFVKDLGPTAQAVASKKLEPLKYYQLLHGEGTSRPQTPANFSDQTRINPPQPPTKSDDPKSADMLSHALSLSNRPLRIPGAAAAHENRSITNTVDSGNIRDDAYKGKKVCVEEGWDTCAAALLGDIFLNYDKEGSSSSGLTAETSNNSNMRGTMSMLQGGAELNTNSRGIMDIRGRSNSQMAIPDYVSCLAGNVPNTNTGGNSISVGISNLAGNYMNTENVTRRPGLVRARVWPTRVISSPQPKPLEFMPVNNALKMPLSSTSRPAFSMTGHNLSGASLLSQPQPANSMSGMSLPGLSVMSQLKPAEFKAGNNISGKSIFPSQAANFSKWSEEDTSSYGLESLHTPYQPGDYHALLGSCLDNSPFPAQPTHDEVLKQATLHNPPVPTPAPAPAAANYGYPDLQMRLTQMNLLGPFPQQKPKSSSSALGVPLENAMNYYGGNAPQTQQELTTAQYLWDDDHKPNLALQL